MFQMPDSEEAGRFSKTTAGYSVVEGHVAEA
jgi:hypothetical protein